MTINELQKFLQQEFPQVADQLTIESVTGSSSRIRCRTMDANLRPGGTVAGPTLFMAADVAMYLVVLMAVGFKPLAVTTNCSIDFMRKPAKRDIIAEARLLKLGRRLTVGDVFLYSDGQSDPVARASLTYAIPS